MEAIQMELKALERKTSKDAQSVGDFLSSENILLGFYLFSDKVAAVRAKVFSPQWMELLMEGTFGSARR